MKCMRTFVPGHLSSHSALSSYGLFELQMMAAFSALMTLNQNSTHDIFSHLLVPAAQFGIKIPFLVRFVTNLKRNTPKDLVLLKPSN